MRNKEVEEKIRQALRQAPAVTTDTHLEDTLFLAREEACRKLARKRISFLHFLIGQIRFMGWKIWIIQGILLFLTGGMLFRFDRYHVTLQTMIKLLFGLSVLTFMTVLPFLYRSVRYQMQEVEAATRFSSARLLLARIIIIGTGDITMIGCVFYITILKTGIPAGSAALYLFFPFLLAGSVCLYMLGHLPPGQSFIGSFLFCILLVMLFCIVPGQWAFWFQQSLSAAWCLVCALLSAFCARQFRFLIRDCACLERLVTES